MHNSQKRDKLAIAAFLVGTIGTLATVAALWGPIFARDSTSVAAATTDSRGMFRMPTIVWRESHGWGNAPSAKVAYTPEGEVVGFGGILSEEDKEYAKSACGGGSQVVTIRDVDYVPDTNIPFGFIGETVEGHRIVFELDSTLPQRVDRVQASFISHVVRESRRAVVTYIMCGTAMVGDIDEIVAE